MTAICKMKNVSVSSSTCRTIIPSAIILAHNNCCLVIICMNLESLDWMSCPPFKPTSISTIVHDRMIDIGSNVGQSPITIKGRITNPSKNKSCLGVSTRMRRGGPQTKECTMFLIFYHPSLHYHTR